MTATRNHTATAVKNNDLIANFNAATAAIITKIEGRVNTTTADAVFKLGRK